MGRASSDLASAYRQAWGLFIALSALLALATPVAVSVAQSTGVARAARVAGAGHGYDGIFKYSNLSSGLDAVTIAAPSPVAAAHRGLAPTDQFLAPEAPGVEAALPRATFGWTDSTDYRATFEAANPNAGDVWVHHAVEQQVLTRYPGLFQSQEIHSLENLRGIPTGAINNQIHLSEIRMMWNDFYEANAAPTRRDVLDFAAQIDRKLGVFFSPSVT